MGKQGGCVLLTPLTDDSSSRQLPHEAAGACFQGWHALVVAGAQLWNRIHQNSTSSETSGNSGIYLVFLPVTSSCKPRLLCRLLGMFEQQQHIKTLLHCRYCTFLLINSQHQKY